MLQDPSPLLHAHLPVAERTEGLTLVGAGGGGWGCSLEERRLVGDMTPGTGLGVGRGAAGEGAWEGCGETCLAGPSGAGQGLGYLLKDEETWAHRGKATLPRPRGWGAVAGLIRMTYSFHTPQEVPTAAMLPGLPGALALTDLKWRE